MESVPRSERYHFPQFRTERRIYSSPRNDSSNPSGAVKRQSAVFDIRTGLHFEARSRNSRSTDIRSSSIQARIVEITSVNESRFPFAVYSPPNTLQLVLPPTLPIFESKFRKA